MKRFLILLSVLALAGLPVRAQSPEDSGAAPVPTAGEAGPAPVEVHPLDRLLPVVSRQLVLLQGLGEIHTLLLQLRQVGPELLVLLDESVEPKERLRRVLAAAPGTAAALPDPAQAQIAELRHEIGALKLLIENSGLQPVPYETVPAPEAVEPEAPEDTDWQLARTNVQYIQLPGRESAGRVALFTDHAHAEIGVRETVDLDGKTITLQQIDPLDDGGVLMTFLADGLLTRIRY